MEIAYSWIKNIVVYMIINTIIMNLLGNKSYKKYVSIVSGMILVLIVISPLIKLMKLEANLDYFLQANDFAIESSNFKNDLSRMEQEQIDQIFVEYRDKIRQQVKELLLEQKVYLETIKLTFNQDVGSATFGEILDMNITASIENSKAKDSNNLTIEEIEISHITIGEESESIEKPLLSPLEIDLKNRLSDFYNIEQGNINISIQGG